MNRTIVPHARDSLSNEETIRPQSAAEPRRLTASAPSALSERPERDRAILLELAGTQPGAVFSVPAPGVLIGRNANTQVTLSDASVSGEHARLTLDEESASVEDLSSLNGTFINNQPIEKKTRLNDGDYLRLGRYTVLKFSMVDEFEETALRTLFELTLRDPLTRLYNRRYFDDRLRGEFAFAQRHGTVLGLLLIDIDHFKQFNDTCGHQVGDIVLKLVTQSIQKMMRPEDVLARYGGEEFVVIIRATSLRNLEILGTRICHRIQALPLNLPEHDLSVTVSVGSILHGPRCTVCLRGGVAHRRRRGALRI